jgi:hypothetical protein
MRNNDGDRGTLEGSRGQVSKIVDDDEAGDWSGSGFFPSASEVWSGDC